MVTDGRIESAPPSPISVNGFVIPFPRIIVTCNSVDIIVLCSWLKFRAVIAKFRGLCLTKFRDCIAGESPPDLFLQSAEFASKQRGRWKWIVYDGQ
jgi:hypothetical protein